MYFKGYRDVVVIPDEYNTGIDIQSCTDAISEPDDKGYIYAGDNPRVGFKAGSSNLVLNGSICTKLGATGHELVHNVDFGTTRVGNLGEFPSDLLSITFENCKFNDVDFSSIGIPLIFKHCDFTSQAGFANAEVVKCAFHHQGTDAIHINKRDYETDKVTIKDSYVYDISTQDNKKGTHLDGVHMTGDNSLTVVNGSTDILPDLELNNVRFSVSAIPKYIDTSTDTGHLNSAIYVQGLRAAVRNVTIKDVIIDVAGRYAPIRIADGLNVAPHNANIVLDNVITADSYNRVLYYDTQDYVHVTSSGISSKIFVSSVINDNDGVKIYVTNLSQNQRTFKVVTNKGESSYTIDATPNYATMQEDSAYAELDYADLPLNVEYNLGTDVEYVVVYDGDEQVRYVEISESSAPDEPTLDESKVIVSKALLVGVAENIRTALGTDEKMTLAIMSTIDLMRVPRLQVKTVSATDVMQEITPDEGYDGFSKIIILAVEDTSTEPEQPEDPPGEETWDFIIPMYDFDKTFAEQYMFGRYQIYTSDTAYGGFKETTGTNAHISYVIPVTGHNTVKINRNGTRTFSDQIWFYDGVPSHDTVIRPYKAIVTDWEYGSTVDIPDGAVYMILSASINRSSQTYIESFESTSIVFDE